MRKYEIGGEIKFLSFWVLLLKLRVPPRNFAFARKMFAFYRKTFASKTIHLIANVCAYKKQLMHLNLNIDIIVAFVVEQHLQGFRMTLSQNIVALSRRYD